MKLKIYRKVNKMKKFLLFTIIILTQCGWNSAGWQEQFNPNYIYYPGAPATTNTTLVTQQSGNIIIFTGTSNNTKFTLPQAVIGLDFTIVGDVAKYFHIVVNSGDIINFSTLVANDGLSNSGSAAKGDSIELICQTAGQWSIKNRQGTWAKDNS